MADMVQCLKKFHDQHQNDMKALEEVQKIQKDTTTQQYAPSTIERVYSEEPTVAPPPPPEFNAPRRLCSVINSEATDDDCHAGTDYDQFKEAFEILNCPAAKWLYCAPLD